MTNRNRRKRTRARIEQDRRERNRVHSSIVLREASFLLMVLIVLMLLTLVMGASNRKMEAQAGTVIHTREEELPTLMPAADAVEALPAETAPGEHWESLGTWKLTAYCPCQKCNGRGRAWATASGAPMEAGKTVAVGGLPFGTELMINGQIYVVQDRGVKGKHADILFPDHDSALAFGVKKAEVFIKR